jgi:predicted  nucleic acid-binding Zn-ribbon protein
MDIDLIESTFSELMGELEKIKDLNELAESYKKKTQVLSEQLERFLSASAEGRNIVMEKIQSVEDVLKSINENGLPELRDSFKETSDGINQKAEEYQNSNADCFKAIDTSLSQIVQEASKSANEIREFEEKAFETQSKLSGLISEKIDGLNQKAEEYQNSNADSFKAIDTSLSQIVQEASKSASDIREFEEKAFETQSKLSGLISEKIDGVNLKNGEFQSSLHGVIKEVHQSNAQSLDNNFNAIKKGHMLNYIQLTLTLIVIALLALILFSK